MGGTLDDLAGFLLAFVLGPLAGALIAGFGYTALVLRRDTAASERGVRPIDKLE